MRMPPVARILKDRTPVREDKNVEKWKYEQILDSSLVSHSELGFVSSGWNHIAAITFLLSALCLLSNVWTRFP